MTDTKDEHKERIRRKRLRKRERLTQEEQRLIDECEEALKEIEERHDEYPCEWCK